MRVVTTEGALQIVTLDAVDSDVGAVEFSPDGAFLLGQASNAAFVWAKGALLTGTTGLAPFHDFDSSISQDIKDTLAEIDAGLQDGSISTGYGQ